MISRRQTLAGQSSLKEAPRSRLKRVPRSRTSWNLTRVPRLRTSWFSQMTAFIVIILCVMRISQLLLKSVVLEIGDRQHVLKETKESVVFGINQTSSTTHKLRYDWTNLPVQSALAKRMVDHQENCNLPLANFGYRNRFGLGSDIHLWGQAICNGMEENKRVRTVAPWIFVDEEECDLNVTKGSSMLCYFPASELLCDEDRTTAEKEEIKHWLGNPKKHTIMHNCSSVLEEGGFGISDVRTATLEYLFRSVSPVLIKEGERQLNLVFPDGVPEKLITVHIRWGDKGKEMELVSIEQYIIGIHKILGERKSETIAPNIYLATEDPKAYAEFKEKAPLSWKVHVDQYFFDMLGYREKENVYNQGPKTSKQTQGRAGLVALGSLLVAMEADDFVLTTASNWSRLMNELRKNVVDPRCNNCTTMVDLRKGKGWYDV